MHLLQQITALPANSVPLAPTQFMVSPFEGKQPRGWGVSLPFVRVYYMPHSSPTESYLLPSGNYWIGYWTSKAKSTMQRFADSSEWGLSPPRPRGAGHRTKLLGTYIRI